MGKNLYLLISREGLFETDIASLKKISEIHRQNPLDTVFVDFDDYRSLRNYCMNNKTASIDFRDVKSKDPIENFLCVLSYRKKNPEKKRIALVSREVDIKKLAELFKEDSPEIFGVQS